MKNLTPVNTFTDPVQVLEDGDAVVGANSEVTAQQLTNRTAFLASILNIVNAAIAVTATSGDAITGNGAANASGVVGNGNGTAPGIKGVGGATGAGVSGVGGATSGPGVLGVATAGNSAGVQGTGQGSGSGVVATGGATGSGVTATGNSGVVASTGASGTGSLFSGVMGALASYGLRIVSSVSSSTGPRISIDDQNSPGGVSLEIKGNGLNPPIRILPYGSPPGGAQVGDLYVTSAGVLKICTAAPSTWTSVGAQT